MNETLTEIMNRKDQQNALVVSHEAAIRNFQRFWCPDDRKLIPGRLYTCTVLVFEDNTGDQRFTLPEVYNPNYQEMTSSPEAG